jgi:hypothetical protein
MRKAHAIAARARQRWLPRIPWFCQISVVGVPKTMDNDILLCEAFGFPSAVEKAKEFISVDTEAVVIRGCVSCNCSAPILSKSATPHWRVAFA